MSFELKHPLPVKYKGMKPDCGYRIDLLVENEIIVELKSVESLEGIHEAQLLTSIKLAGIEQGSLINFNVALLKQGLKCLFYKPREEARHIMSFMLMTKRYQSSYFFYDASKMSVPLRGPHP
ncbi:MAG: GxxExxY protein [Thermodesulfobacteriota bacterium]